MNRVVVTVLGRPWWLTPTLVEMRRQALYPVHITCVVDGDPAIDWHHVHQNTVIAQQYADHTLVLSRHAGNGPAFAAGVQAGSMDEPIMKVDADILPSRHWDLGLMSAAKGYDNGTLFGLVGLQRRENRANVGIRRCGANRKFTINLAVFMPRALALLGDHAVPAPINYHEKVMLKAANRAGLWYGVTERAWVETHLGDWDRADDAYKTWKLAYL